jgi:hypothetical protein
MPAPGAGGVQVRYRQQIAVEKRALVGGDRVHDLGFSAAPDR